MRTVLLLSVAVLSVLVLASRARQSSADRRMRADFAEWDVTQAAGA
jgi:hypothetical protein